MKGMLIVKAPVFCFPKLSQQRWNTVIVSVIDSVSRTRDLPYFTFNFVSKYNNQRKKASWHLNKFCSAIEVSVNKF